MDTSRSWANDIYAVFKAQQVSIVSYVPDAGHAHLINLCRDDAAIQVVPLTTEEEGVALAAGAWLGGRRAALLMQSSGVGNTVNALSLIKVGAFPFLTLVTMRGEWGEFNPWQIPMGQATPDVLKAMGVAVYPVTEVEQVRPTVEAAAKLAFSSYVGVAVLLSQRLVGAKTFGAEVK